jgi:hypothetical protein
MSILLRRAFITVPPLVLAGVLLMHPNDEGDTIYASGSPTLKGPQAAFPTGRSTCGS